ncbi:MAG: hypothetical protein IJQ81_03730, partial [Oscillibacter sp.]|nr:hypothetical protein [Oscillibacter sp.]
MTQSPLSGVMFRITTATGEYVPNNDGRTSSNGFFTTDSAGEILLTGVTGTLVVTEFSTISGYVIDEATRSQTVVVSSDDTQTLVFYNEPMTTLTVQKYATGTTTPLKGARFFVSDSHGLPLGNSNGMFVTDENGRFVISDLIPGLSVTVKETEAPEGYVLDSTPQTIRMRSGISAQTLTFYNAPKGSISVRKLDAVTEQPLAGAEFKVTTANGIPLDNDGGKISTNGIYRTDDNGQFLITKVQPGIYTLTETKAPDGYIL